MIFDPDIRYGCVRCGKSCRHDWDIWIHRDLPARLEPHLAKLKLTRENAFVYEQGRVRLARDQHGCRFLQDSLCSLHCQLGVFHKPNFCQQYPWFFVDTPEGIRVSASYTCTAVLQGAGPPLGEQRAEIEKCLAQNPALDVSLLNWEETVDFHRRFAQAVERELWALCLLRCLAQARAGRRWAELEPAQGPVEDMAWPRRLVVGALLKPCLDHDQELWSELDRALGDGGEVKIPQFGYAGSGAELLEWAARPLEEEVELERYRRSLWFRRQHLRCAEPLAGLLLNWAPAPLYRVLARLTNGAEALERIEMTIGHGRGVERVFGLLAGYLI
ncbi:MAG: hypothetical protein KF760_08705 [Candidatus Eremiobacteraeota bacterium]|nr:hypothetical protein [Candidatus Eremiobacteraeota bacterium]MCW5870694.1 hypothetical protein [Candidatus Eremiobacteraeota bacterium]